MSGWFHIVRWTVLAAVASLCAAPPAGGQSLQLQARDAVVWQQRQLVRGVADGDVQTATLYVNGEPTDFTVEGGRFEVDVAIVAGENVLVACDGDVCSDTLRLELGYTPRPEPYAYAEVDGREVTLRAEILESPAGPIASYAWQADPDNPASVSLVHPTSAAASVTFSDGAPPGEYYFDVVASDVLGRQGKARTLVTVDAATVTPFDVRRDRAAWIDRAIVYEVTPYTFHGNGTWRDVTRRLPEIAALGVNTLWIQPVFATAGGGQGYDVTDYFRLRSDLGTPDDLRELVRSAKQDHGLRVLFDFVPNHTSIEHPYARDVLEHGVESHYFGYYLTEPDDAPYSRHYNRGRGPFLYYFWDDLVILDWAKPEVYRWMMEAGRYWIEAFDIDGYRIDAVWGVNARTPRAMQDWRFDLKRLKPEIFLLGEDKATWPSSFEERFDAAYDWYPGESWVSQWAWQAPIFNEHQNRTIFNTAPEDGRSDRLRAALTNQGNGWHPDANVFRFMENNDTYPFLEWHGLERTKMAANLLFSLPGVPMLYNGQEIGREGHPYSRWQTFMPGTSIQQQDAHGLYAHYSHLVRLRSSFSALHGGGFQEVAVTERLAARVFAFRRWLDDEHVLSIVNMGSQSETVRLQVPIEEMGMDVGGTYFMTDLMTGERSTLSGTQLRFALVQVPGYTTRLIAVSEQVVEIPTAIEDEGPAAGFAPGRNYPNPFGASTTIAFTLSDAGPTRVDVYDVLGRRVERLVDERLPPGRHEVRFQADGLASGVYLYRIEQNGRIEIRRMLLAR